MSCVVNWDDCHIGKAYEDLAGLILNFSGVADKYRNNINVFSAIKCIFETYGARQETIGTVIQFIRSHIADSVLKLDLNSEQDIKKYETFKWCETFFDIYSQHLIEAKE